MEAPTTSAPRPAQPPSSVAGQLGGDVSSELAPVVVETHIPAAPTRNAASPILSSTSAAAAHSAAPVSATLSGAITAVSAAHQLQSQQQQEAGGDADEERPTRAAWPGLYHSHQRIVQQERLRQRYYAQRRRVVQPSVASWVWTRLSSRLRKSTVTFFEALDAGRVDAVRELVRGHPAFLLRARPGTRWTAVHYAAERGEFATLTALFEEAEACDRQAAAAGGALTCLSRGARSTDFVKKLVNSSTEKNLTPLMLACKRGHPATATFLMAAGSNPCVADREGAKMAIHYACLYGHWSCTQVMMEPRWVVQNADGLKPLAQALITDMHGEKRYIDARTCAGLTPLHMAAWAGHVEVAKILLQHGAFLNPKIVFSSPSTSSVLPGSTPTHLATRKNRIHVVKALLTAYVERKQAAEAGGAPHEDDPRTIPDDRGNYAIMHAITRGNASMTALLDANADLETILVTDLSQLGQVPKLQVVALAALRTRLRRELGSLLGTLKRRELDLAGKGDDDCASGRSFILDGSPKSLRPTDVPTTFLPDVSSVQLQWLDSGALNTGGGRPSASTHLGGGLMHDSMVDIGTQPLEDLACSVKSRDVAAALARSEGDDLLCGICMEHAEAVQLTRCAHRVCATCAQQLLAPAAVSSCRCPFCRKFIGGFEACVPAGA